MIGAVSGPMKLRASLKGLPPDRALERVQLIRAARAEDRQRRSPAIRGAALVFHATGPRKGDPDFELNPALDVDTLDAMVGYLSRSYRMVTASELPTATAERRIGEPLPIAATFDDDLPSHAEVAAPVFARHGVTATAFIGGLDKPLWFQLLTPAIDNRSIRPADLPPIPPALVSAALERRPRAIVELAHAIINVRPQERDVITEVLADSVHDQPAVLGAAGARTLAAAGWEIGFHTKRHDVLTSLDEAELREAVTPSIVKPGGSLPSSIAFPHGLGGAREAAAASDAGFDAAYTMNSSVLTERTDPHQLGRLYPNTHSLGKFAVSLANTIAAEGKS